MNTIDKLLVVGAGSALGLYLPVLKNLEVDLFIYDKDKRRMKDAISIDGFKEFKLRRCSEPGFMLNLTPASIHHEINKIYLDNGWSVYSEKPLVKSDDELLACKKYLGERLWIAPDICLFDNYQEFSRLVRLGGSVLNVQCVYKTTGHELWHPRPWVFYTLGGGVINDIFPYFSRVLFTLLGSYKILDVDREFSSRHDLFPKDKIHESENVPVYCQAKLLSEGGVHIDLELDFNSKNNESYICVETENYRIMYDPVDTASEVKILDSSNGIVQTFKPSNPDQRGLGIQRILDSKKYDPFFSVHANKQDIYREQQMILLLNQGERSG